MGRSSSQIRQKIPEAQSKELNQKIANGYLMYASWFKEEENNSTYKEKLVFI